MTDQTAAAQNVSENPQAPTIETTTHVGDGKTTDFSASTDSSAWNDAEYTKLSARYKGDAKEIAKAKWNQDKEMTRLTQELAALKKNQPQANQTSSPSPSSSTGEASNDQQVNEVAADVAANKPDSQPDQKGPNLPSLGNQLYLELFDGNKPSEQTINAYKELGYSDAQIAMEIESKQTIMARRIKEAQSFVDTPVQDLRKFAEQEGNFTDKELSVIQNSLDLAAETGDPEFYRVLKVVEKRFKSKATVAVEHGAINPSATTGDSYSDPKDYFRDQKSSQYGWNKEFTAAVDAKYARSDKSDWNERLLNRR